MLRASSIAGVDAQLAGPIDMEPRQRSAAVQQGDTLRRSCDKHHLTAAAQFHTLECGDGHIFDGKRRSGSGEHKHAKRDGRMHIA
jgi:hypothetical protein